MKIKKLQGVLVVALAVTMLGVTGCNNKGKVVNESDISHKTSNSTQAKPFTDAEILVKEAFGEDDPYYEYRVEKTKKYCELADRLFPTMEPLVTYGITRKEKFEQSEADFQRGKETWALSQYGTLDVGEDQSQYTSLSLDFYKDEENEKEMCDYELRFTLNCKTQEEVKISEDYEKLIFTFDDAIKIDEIQEVVKRAYEDKTGNFDEYITIKGKEDYTMRVYHTVMNDLNLDEIDISIAKVEECQK